jgi:hypothetical protein
MKRLIIGLGIALMMTHVVAAQDLDTSYTALQAAVEAKKSAAELKPVAVDVLTQANKAIAAGGDEEAVKHAKEIGAYAEYALYTAAIAGPAAVTVDLMGALETLSPKSQYLPTGYPTYLAALGPKAGAVAEKALKNFPEDRTLLMAAADGAMAANQPDKTVAFAKRALAAKGDASLNGRLHWMIGVSLGAKNQFFESDKELRAALPGIQGQNALLGAAYYFLGVDNYQLGRQALNKAQVLEGAKFSDQSAAIPGNYQRQAFTNSQLIKAEAAKMR